jgi:FMN phosphatase YigB (HAD superfamily)
MTAHSQFPNIAACVFDAYGTLFDVSRVTEPAREKLGEKTEALARLWREKQLQYTWLRSLMNAHTDFWHVTGDADPAEEGRLEDRHPLKRLDHDAGRRDQRPQSARPAGCRALGRRRQDL